MKSTLTNLRDVLSGKDRAGSSDHDVSVVKKPSPNIRRSKSFEEEMGGDGLGKSSFHEFKKKQDNKTVNKIFLRNTRTNNSAKHWAKEMGVNEQDLQASHTDLDLSESVSHHDPIYFHESSGTGMTMNMTDDELSMNESLRAGEFRRSDAASGDFELSADFSMPPKSPTVELQQMHEDVAPKAPRTWGGKPKLKLDVRSAKNEIARPPFGKSPEGMILSWDRKAPDAPVRGSKPKLVVDVPTMKEQVGALPFGSDDW